MQTKSPNSYNLAINFEHLYAGYSGKTILYDVNLQVAKGNMVAVIGNSGAGKSTGIRCMTAQIVPLQGKALTAGISVQNREIVQSRIGYVPQLEYVSLYYDFSAEKNALFFGRNYGLSDKYIKARCREVMEILGIGQEEFIKKKVKLLSGGEKKRVSIMVGLISNPEILFLDEPTTGLDPHLRIEVLNFLHEINKRFGTTIMIVSHDLECVDYCDQVIVFTKGTIVDSGEPRECIEMLPNHGVAFETTFENISIAQEETLENLTEIQYILHVGRNKFKFFCDSKEIFDNLLQLFKQMQLKIIYLVEMESTFLDYFRIMSKYKYEEQATILQDQAILNIKYKIKG